MVKKDITVKKQHPIRHHPFSGLNASAGRVFKELILDVSYFANCENALQMNYMKL